MRRLSSARYLMDELLLTRTIARNYANAFLAMVVLHSVTLMIVIWMFL